MPHHNEYEYKYNEKADFYCYPNSHVLINKFNILDCNALNVVERQITALKIAELNRSPMKGNFDLKHLQKIHQFIFEDVYDFAGEIRKGDFLIKGDSIFCRAMFIESMASEIFEKLKTENFLKMLSKANLIKRLSFYMGEINALHPFREGNGRAQRLYFKQLCNKAGFNLDFHITDKNALIKADIAAFNRDYSLLINLLDYVVSEKK